MFRDHDSVIVSLVPEDLSTVGKVMKQHMCNTDTQFLDSRERLEAFYFVVGPSSVRAPELPRRERRPVTRYQVRVEMSSDGSKAPQVHPKIGCP